MRASRRKRGATSAAPPPARILDGEALAEIEVLRLVDDAAGAAADLAHEPVTGAAEDVALSRGRGRLGGRDRRGRGGREAGRGRQVAAGGLGRGHQAGELAARLAGLAREEGGHQVGDARSHAALAAGQHGGRGEQARQLRGGGAGGEVAGVAVPRGELGEDGVELRGGADLGGDGGQILGVPRDGGHVRAGVALEEALAGAELPDHHAERVEVDPGVAGVPVGHLRRDVAGLGEDHPGDRVAAPVLPAGGAEIDDLALAPVAHHHVLRRQVAVDDGEALAGRIEPLVHVGERLGDERAHGHRAGPPDGLPDLERPGAHVAQGLALDVLDHGVGLARAVVDGRVEHLRHPRVLELRLHARLVQEAGDEAGIPGVLAADDLDHHRPLGPLDAGGGGEEDLPHAAAGDALHEQVPAQGARDVFPVPRRIVLADPHRFGRRHASEATDVGQGRPSSCARIATPAGVGYEARRWVGSSSAWPCCSRSRRRCSCPRSPERRCCPSAIPIR